MGMLHVSLLGSIRIRYDDYPMEVKMTHSIQRLLVYLILFRDRTHQREVLAEILWGDKDQARSRDSLNTALWHLRKTIESCGINRDAYLLSDHPDEIGFNTSGPLWLDVKEFQDDTNQVTQTQPSDALEAQLSKLEHAIGLYRGDLLEGFYDDWVLREREFLRNRYLSTLICLMGAYQKHSEYEKSLSCGQKILDLDPLREEIHRSMIQLYIETGQRALAVRQFELCRVTLARELRIEPMEETQELYRRLISETCPSTLQVQSSAGTELQRAIYQLNQARSTFELACDQLKQSIDTVDRALKNQGK
jgi:DNA-binding SARP family transcriptional activator